MAKWSNTFLVATALFGMAVLGCTGGCEPKPRLTDGAEASVPHVRVRLLAGVPKVTLLAKVATPVLDQDSQKQVGIELPAERPIDVMFDGTNWLFGDKGVRGVTLSISPTVDGSIQVNKSAYRGRFTLVAVGPNQIDVINNVDVESYLQGVLARELLPDWHPQAYRAQAVIARTYALYEVKTNPAGKTWDLNPDERSQVYGGVSAETPKSNAAVAETRGIVAAYGAAGQERIFKAYFSACCGGISSSAADVFNEPAIAPLSAKSNGTTCSMSTRYNWPPVTLSKAELTRRFRTWGTKQGRPEANLPGVRSIQITGTNNFGRPRAFMLTDTRNQQYVLTAEQLRWAINTDPNNGPTVFSGFFTPTDTGDAIRFENGHGFGHGVGACQWCMQARALAGESFQQIVLQAFPKSVMVLAY